MNSYIHSIHAYTALAERVIDVPGYIPVLSFTTLQARVAIAAFQAICAFSFALHEGYLSLIQSKSVTTLERLQRKEYSRHMAYFASNAFQNLCRAILESLPVLGNTICLAWDWKKSRLSSIQLAGSFGPIGNTDWHRPFIHYVIFPISETPVT